MLGQLCLLQCHIIHPFLHFGREGERVGCRFCPNLGDFSPTGPLRARCSSSCYRRSSRRTTRVSFTMCHSSTKHSSECRWGLERRGVRAPGLQWLDINMKNVLLITFSHYFHVIVISCKLLLSNTAPHCRYTCSELDLPPSNANNGFRIIFIRFVFHSQYFM